MYDGNGTFQRVMNWVQDAASAIKIKADRHDQQDDDFAAGLTNCITKDGQTQPTNDIPMNAKKIVNLGPPTNATDAATKAYVDAVKTFSTGLEISGADALGQLKFTSTTGANGLTFTGADLSWLARLADASATPPKLNRLVLNDKPDGSGTDVIEARDDGTLVASHLAVYAASALVAIRPTTGNGHVYWYGADGTVRMILYTASGAQGNGNLTVGASNFAFQSDGVFRAPVHVYAGAAIFTNDGNVQGTIWDSWGAHDAFNAISARIEERASAYARLNVGSIYMQRAAITYSGHTPGGGGGWIAPSGTVIVGYNREAGTTGEVAGLCYATLQIFDPVNGWRTMGG